MSLLGWLQELFWHMICAMVVPTALPTAKLCCFLAIDDFFLVSSTAKRYAVCRFHVSLYGYRMGLAATAKHYAIRHLQVSLIGYSYVEVWVVLTEKLELCWNHKQHTFVVFCVSYSKALRYMSTYIQLAFDRQVHNNLVWQKLMIVAFASHNSACFHESSFVFWLWRW